MYVYVYIVIFVACAFKSNTRPHAKAARTYLC